MSASPTGPIVLLMLVHPPSTPATIVLPSILGIGALRVVTIVTSPFHHPTRAQKPRVSSEVIAIAVAAQAERGEPPGPPRGPSFVAVQVASAPDRRHYRRRRYGEPSQQPQNAAAGRRSACSTPTVAGDEWPGWPAARAAAFATRRYMCRSHGASVSLCGHPAKLCGG